MMRTDVIITDPRAVQTHTDYLKYMTHWKMFEQKLAMVADRPAVPLPVLKEIAKGNFVELASLLGVENDDQNRTNTSEGPGKTMHRH